MVPPKRSLICDMLVFALENSTILINKIPKVQRLALIQSIHYKALHNKNENTSSTDKEVLEILLYNFQTTPYLSNTDFYDAVAESMQLISSSSSYIDNETAIAIEQMIRDENWDELVSYTNAPNFTYNQALDSGELQRIRSNDDQRLLGFREMVQSIISTSKVLTKMKPSKRKRLEKSIQHATTVEDVLEKVTIFLGKSNIFKQETDVKKIKDLIAVGRFDLLLLPGCFDCDDKERLQEQNRHGSIENHNDEECIDEEEYCVICLEDMNHSFGTTTLECNHRFCTNCIQSWFMNHSTCPTCRKMISGTRLRLNHRREPRPNSDVNNSSLDIIDGLVNGAWSAIQFLLALPIVLAWSAIYFLLLLLAYALEFIQAALEAALELLLPLLAILKIISNHEVLLTTAITGLSKSENADLEEACKNPEMRVEMFRGKKTLFWNGEELRSGSDASNSLSFLIYDRRERDTWEMIVILPGVEEIPDYTFAWCRNIKTVIMADTVERMGRDTFCHCESLVFVRMSRNLECIGFNAFWKCHSLISIFIPPSCREIGPDAFEDCSELIIFHVPQHTRLGLGVIANTALLNASQFELDRRGYYRQNNREVNEWIKNIHADDQFSLHRACASYNPLEEVIYNIVKRQGIGAFEEPDSVGVTPLQYLSRNPFSEIEEQKMIKQYILDMMGEIVV